MVRVGEVMGVFGIEGAVKVRSLTDFPDRFAPGSELFLDGVGHRVEWSRQQPAGLVVKLTGLDSRTAAETARGRFLEVPEEAIRPLPAGRWYHHQLVGLAVRSEAGRDLGALAEVLTRPANDIWVARREGREVLIPVIPDAVLSVDLEAGRVVIADWLLDVEEA